MSSSSSTKTTSHRDSCRGDTKQFRKRLISFDIPAERARERHFTVVGRSRPAVYVTLRSGEKKGPGMRRSRRRLTSKHPVIITTTHTESRGGTCRASRQSSSLARCGPARLGSRKTKQFVVIKMAAPRRGNERGRGEGVWI